MWTLIPAGTSIMATSLERRDHALHCLGIDVAVEAHTPAADQLDLDSGSDTLDDYRRRRWWVDHGSGINGRRVVGDPNREEGRALRARRDAQSLPPAKQQTRGDPVLGRATRDTDAPGRLVSSTMRRLASSLNRRRTPGSMTTLSAGSSSLGLSDFGLSDLGPELGLSRG
jgi:hypothetical protein